jgi:hypothetical protein
MIEYEEALTFHSGSDNESISIIEFPMHNASIFNEQAKVKEPGV